MNCNSIIEGMRLWASLGGKLQEALDAYELNLANFQVSWPGKFRRGCWKNARIREEGKAIAK